MANDSSATLAALKASGLAIGGVDSAVTGVSKAVIHPPEVRSAATADVAISTAALQAPTATGTAISGVVTAFNLPQVLPYPIANGRGYQSLVSQETLPGVLATGIAYSGVLGVSSATRQQITANGFAGGASTGVSQATLQNILAEGFAFLGTGATFSAVVIGTEGRNVISTYTNFAFNSFARLNGVTLAAGDGGLYTLGGDTDDTVQITGAVRVGVTDHGTTYRTRVERVYLGYRTAGKLILRVTTDGLHVRDYLVHGNGKLGIHGAHVRLGRGLEARYWQYEILNQAGVDFSLNLIECKPIKLRRRVGGNDA